MNDDYLERQLIEASFDITNDIIKITSSHTTYIHAIRIKKIEKNTIINLYNEIVKLAKEKKIRVSRENGWKKFIVENWEEYEKNLNYYNDLFNTLILKCQEVQKRGIHIGTIDDEVLKEASLIANKHNEVYYRTSIVEKIKEVLYSLNKLKESFSLEKCNIVSIRI